MYKKFPTWVLAVIVLGIWLINAIASAKHLYYYIWWLDIPMHLIGGFWVGLTVLTYYFAYQNKFAKTDATRFAVLLSLGGTFIVAIGWEAFEWGVDRVNGLTRFDLVDSLSDVCNGVIGATLSSVLFIKKGYNKST